MPWHFQDPREEVYAQPYCGASYLTGGTLVAKWAASIDCPQCREAALKEMGR